MFTNLTKDKKWSVPILRGQVTEMDMLGKHLTTTGANYITLDLALCSAKTARKLGIKPETVETLLLQQLRGPQWQTRKPSITYFRCGVQGHYMNECQKLKDQNIGNQNS
ncbi:hypothetical protein Tco_0814798, partial [Tanacetum coccineum]